VVYAKTDLAAGAKGMTAFFWIPDTPGFPSRKSSTSSAIARLAPGRAGINNVEVPEGELLGGLGEGTKVLMSGLDYERAVLERWPRWG